MPSGFCAKGELGKNRNHGPPIAKHIDGNEEQKEKAVALIKQLLDQYHIEIIAIGNGTACEETEQFIQSVVDGEKISVVLVNEAGASVYSASQTGNTT